MRDLDWPCSTIIWNLIVWDHVFHYCYTRFGLSHKLLWIGHGHVRTKSHRHVHWMIMHALHACPQESKSNTAEFHKILIVQDWIKKCLIQLAILNHTILCLQILKIRVFEVYKSSILIMKILFPFKWSHRPSQWSYQQLNP
jgi:hypothetical protein